MNHGYLLLSEYFAPSLGGTPTWFSEVYARLEGASNHVITAAIAGSDAIDGCHPARIHRLPLQRVPWLRPESLPMYGRLLARALSLVCRRRFRALHAGRALPEGLVALVAGRLSAHPVVVYAHGEELTGWGCGYKFRAMRAVLRRADCVIANSANTRELLLALGVAEARIVVIHPGVDCTRFHPGLDGQAVRQRLGVPASAQVVLSVGRLQPRKGFLTVLESLPGLLRRGLDVHHVVVGKGEQAPALQARAAALGLAARFHLLEDISPAELPACYAACEVFAMPNVDVAGDIEGFGIVFLEAAACGKPAVAGIAGGTAAAVVHGETGLRVDGTRQAAVEAALARLLLEQVLATKLGATARARAVAAFDWSQVAARTARLSPAC